MPLRPPPQHLAPPSPTIHPRERVTPTKKSQPKPKAVNLIYPSYTMINKEIIVELVSPNPDTLAKEAIFNVANDCFASTVVKQVRVRRTREANVCLFTNNITAAFSLETYFKSIFFAIRLLGVEV